VFAELRRDIQAVRERDPAARSTLEVLLCYPGVHALACHRFAHAIWRRGWKIPARFLSHIARFFTGIEIHPAAKLGPGLIDHGMSVIGETAEVGENVTLLQGVTLGGTSLGGEAPSDPRRQRRRRRRRCHRRVQDRGRQPHRRGLGRRPRGADELRCRAFRAG
jgi:serine O-acetyltransferase